MNNFMNNVRSLLTSLEDRVSVLIGKLKAAFAPTSEEDKLDRDLKRVQQRAVRIQSRNNAAAEAHERTIETLNDLIARLDDGITKAEIAEQGIRRLLGQE